MTNNETTEPHIYLEWEGDVEDVKCYRNGQYICQYCNFEFSFDEGYKDKDLYCPECGKQREHGMSERSRKVCASYCRFCDGTGLTTQCVKVRVELRTPFVDGGDVFYFTSLYKKHAHTVGYILKDMLIRHKAGEKVEGVTVI